MSQPLKVWSKFSVTKQDGSVLNLRIVDMPEDPEVKEKVMECFFEYFVKEECTYKASGKSSMVFMVFNLNFIKFHDYHIIYTIL